MRLKVLFGVIAMLLMLGFVAPIVFKLRDVALTIVILIGVVMMAYDLWESIKERDI